MQITEEQRKLVEENHNLIYSFLQKYKLSVDDYYGLAAIGLCKAGSAFDVSKSNFSTYAYKCMFNEIMHEIRKKTRARMIPEYQIVYYQAELNDNNGGDTAKFMNYIPSKENVEDNVISEIIFDEYASKLKERDKKIFSLFREGYKQREICKIVGCSQPQVSRVKKKLVKYLTS